MACIPLFTVSPTPDNTAPGTVQPVPTGIVNGQTVLLTGGVVHSGTLVISGLLNVIIKQTGVGVAVIRPAAGSNGINATAASSCVIGTISSTGSNSIKILSANFGIALANASDITVSRVDIFNTSGFFAIQMQNTSACTIQRCYIESSSCSSVIGGPGSAKNNNYTENTLLFNSFPTSTQGRGIYIENGSSNSITSNRIANMSYHGISVLHPTNTTISCNTLSNCPDGTDQDSGAIYTQHIGVIAGAVVNCQISSNSITGGIGHGIYLDAPSQDITVQRNTIRSCSTIAAGAIELHQSNNCVILSNSAVNCGRCLIFSGPSSTLYNNTISNNIFRDPKQVLIKYEGGTEWIGEGTFINNYYFSDVPFVNASTVGGANNYTYAQWKNLVTAQDVNSTFNVTVGSLTVTGEAGVEGPSNTFMFAGSLRKLLRR